MAKCAALGASWCCTRTRLSGSLRRWKGRAGFFPFPADLFEAVGVRLGVLYAPVEQGPAIVARRPGRPAGPAGRPRVLPMLEVVAEGARNASLFDVLRWWSYAQDRGAVLAHWYDQVRDHALQHNERFPAPLPAWEVRKVAYNVASWTWSGHGAVDLTRCAAAPGRQKRQGAPGCRCRARP